MLVNTNAHVNISSCALTLTLKIILDTFIECFKTEIELKYIMKYIMTDRFSNSLELEMKWGVGCTVDQREVILIKNKVIRFGFHKPESIL